MILSVVHRISLSYPAFDPTYLRMNICLGFPDFRRNIHLSYLDFLSNKVTLDIDFGLNCRSTANHYRGIDFLRRMETLDIDFGLNCRSTANHYRETHIDHHNRTHYCKTHRHMRYKEGKLVEGGSTECIVGVVRLSGMEDMRGITKRSKTHIFPRTRKLPQFPISPKPLFLSKNRLRNPPKPVLKQNKKLCTYAQKKIFGKKKSFFRKKFFATGLIFERFLAPRSRFFEKVNGLGVLGVHKLRLNGMDGNGPAVWDFGEFAAGERRGMEEASGKPCQRQSAAAGPRQWCLRVNSSFFFHYTFSKCNMRRYSKKTSANRRVSSSSSQQNEDSPPQQEGYRPTFDPTLHQQNLAFQAWMQSQPQYQYQYQQPQQPQYPTPQYPTHQYQYQQPQYQTPSPQYQTLSPQFHTPSPQFHTPSPLSQTSSPQFEPPSPFTEESTQEVLETQPESSDSEDSDEEEVGPAKGKAVRKNWTNFEEEVLAQAEATYQQDTVVKDNEKWNQLPLIDDIAKRGKRRNKISTSHLPTSQDDPYDLDQDDDLPMPPPRTLPIGRDRAKKKSKTSSDSSAKSSSAAEGLAKIEHQFANITAELSSRNEVRAMQIYTRDISQVQGEELEKAKTLNAHLKQKWGLPLANFTYHSTLKSLPAANSPKSENCPTCHSLPLQTLPTIPTSLSIV
ncbi:hypothetical protein LXL04_018139 [Taraxacum kok-saghyz]